MRWNNKEVLVDQIIPCVYQRLWSRQNHSSCVDDVSCFAAFRIFSFSSLFIIIFLFCRCVVFFTSILLGCSLFCLFWGPSPMTSHTFSHILSATFLLTNLSRISPTLILAVTNLWLSISSFQLFNSHFKCHSMYSFWLFAGVLFIFLIWSKKKKYCSWQFSCARRLT